MYCIYCKHPVGENTKKCENCGAELSLPAKWRGQHVRKKDLFSVDTLFAVIATILTVVVLFLPVCGFHGSSGSKEYTLWQGFTTMGEAGGSEGIRVWFLVLFLAFTVIFICSWFLGEKSNHYFWIAASGTIGSWLMCIVCTFFMAQTCAYLGYTSLSLTTGYYIWIAALVLQTVSAIFYRWRTKILNRGR